MTTLRRFALLLLHLALVTALWTTALGRLSERPTAIRLLTGVGTHVINPVLTAGGSGIGPAAYSQLQRIAQARPDATLPIPGLKVQIRGADIAGQSFDAGTRTIYAKVATAYYDGGPDAAFALPPNLTSVLTDYGALAQFAQEHGSPIALPQIPSGLLDLLSHIGLSASTFTQAGHDGTVRVATFAWIAALLLGLLVFLLSRRWGRLFSLSSALTNSALSGLIVLAILWFAIGRDPTRFPALNGLADIVFGAFVPVYLGAFGVGLLGQAASGILHVATRVSSRARPAFVVSPAPPPPSPAHIPPQSLPYRPYAGYGPQQYPRVPYDDYGPTDPDAPTQPF